MTLREKIYPGDSYLMSVEARKTDPDNPHDSRGIPADVLSAVARVLDSLTGEFVDIGGPGITVVDAQVVPMAGDTGAIVSYLFPDDFTQEAGSFKIFLRCFFNEFVDGEQIILTEDRAVIVNEYR